MCCDTNKNATKVLMLQLQRYLIFNIHVRDYTHVCEDYHEGHRESLPNGQREPIQRTQRAYLTDTENLIEGHREPI